MVTFKTSASVCDSEEQVNFFSSGNYTAPSYSVEWTTRLTPDVEGITTPVYLLVLDKFNIPVDSSGGLPPGGTLPGIDIKNMSAIEAIKLSLAESLVQGQWWDMNEDTLGGVSFVKVFDNGAPGVTVSLDVRLCIPTASKANEVDMVIVHGYTPPVERYAGPWKTVIPAGTGTINPTNVNGNERLFTIDHNQLLDGVCLSAQVNHVIKSYPDPHKEGEDTAYGSQTENPFYSVNAFESIVMYAQRVSGMDEEDAQAARIKYVFNQTTPWCKLIDFPTFSQVTAPSIATECFVQDSTIVYYEGEEEIVVPNFRDKYGTEWPLYLKPTNIYYAGNKLEELYDYGGEATIAYVNATKDFKKLAAGSNWLWYGDGNSTSRYQFRIFYQPKKDPLFWDTVLAATGAPTEIRYSDGTDFTTGLRGQYKPAAVTLNLMGLDEGLGYVIDKLWIEFELDRPCVTITDTSGQGGQLAAASNFKLEAAPLIAYKPPAPVAYKWSGGVVQVDQTVGLVDSDPTTCQNLEETPLLVMQDRQQGNTLEVNLPFCETVEVCAEAASTIYDYQNFTAASTYVLTCGPNDEPILGAAVSGYDSALRISSINYTYQDAGAFNVEVTLGPVFATVGSWNNSAWLRKVEAVTREAIVIYVGGDGVNYRVYVRGLGEFTAVNTTNTIFRSGEIVSVNISNVPQEE